LEVLRNADSILFLLFGKNNIYPNAIGIPKLNRVMPIIINNMRLTRERNTCFGSRRAH